MKLSKTVKRLLSLALAIVVIAASVVVAPVTKKAEAAKTYNAYLCLATENWTYRNAHDDPKFSNKLDNTTNELSASASKAKFTDVKIKKAKKAAKYTVSLTGLKADVMGNESSFNSLFVDTDIPGSMVNSNKITVTNVQVVFDGKKVKTFKKAVLTPDPGSSDGFAQILIVNTWNDRVEKFNYSMPKKSIKITFTIKFK